MLRTLRGRREGISRGSGSSGSRRPAQPRGGTESPFSTDLVSHGWEGVRTYSNWRLGREDLLCESDSGQWLVSRMPWWGQVVEPSGSPWSVAVLTLGDQCRLVLAENALTSCPK